MGFSSVLQMCLVRLTNEVRLVPTSFTALKILLFMSHGTAVKEKKMLKSVRSINDINNFLWMMLYKKVRKEGGYYDLKMRR